MYLTRLEDVMADENIDREQLYNVTDSGDMSHTV